MNNRNQELKKIINMFYQAAGMTGWNGNVNEHVAEVFSHMLIESQNCLNDYTWALRPGESDSIMEDIIFQVDSDMIKKLAETNKESTCLEFVIERWDGKLTKASYNL